ncbi:MAG: hypothetical protein ACTHOM_08920 [Allomuricauda sp.]
MKTSKSRRAQEGYGFWWNIVHIFQGLFAISLLWNFASETINKVSNTVGGSDFLPAAPLSLKGIDFCSIQFDDNGNIIGSEGPLPPELCAILAGCIFGGFLVWLIFKLICWTEWVKEEIEWEECWEEKDWYNPWHWITTLVCVTKKAIQWVLQKICKYLDTVIVILVIICVVVGVVAML